MERLRSTARGQEAEEPQATVLAWEERSDLLVHALAQLPDDLRLQIEPNHPDIELVDLLTSAYGIRDQVDLAATSRSGQHGLVLCSSAPCEAVTSPAFQPPIPMATLIESLSRTQVSPPEHRSGDPYLTGQRIAIVTNLPTHYRVPLFNSLSRRFQSEGAKLRVLFLARTSAGRSWIRPGTFSFDHAYLRGIDLMGKQGRRVIPFDLERELRSFAPTVIVSAGLSPFVSGRVAHFARRRRLPCGIWSGEIASRRSARGKLRHWQRRHLLRHLDFGLAYGVESMRYFRTLKPELPVVLARNSAAIPPSRERPDRPTPVELLTVARAERGKALDVIVHAVRRRKDLDCRLTVIGDGPQLPVLKELANGDERIRFLGSLPSDQARLSFSQADVFLFPSRYDIFGLVLVEAMGSGLAAIVSEEPGAVADLCVSGVNSLIVKSGGVDDWGAALSRVIEDHEFRLSLGEAAAQTIRKRWTIEHAAEAMLAGVRLGVRIGRLERHQ
jgi:glycosyltransferase involved in cell wall biosynthesis